MHKSVLLVALGLVGLAACQDSVNVAAPGSVDGPRSESAESAVPPSQRQSPAAASAAGELRLMQSDRGQFVADAAGSALYALDGDVAGEGCIDICLEVWPPMLVSEAQPGVAAGLRSELVSSITRPDGTRQVTYANQPLYRYSGDSGVGRTTGHGVEDQWGKWHLVDAGGRSVKQADATAAKTAEPDEPPAD